MNAGDHRPHAPGEHIFENRPWGRFDQYSHDETTTVKVITVEPGQRLSLQRHAHRSEYWIVLDGPVDVTVGEDTWTAQTGDKAWVEVGEAHRLGNSGQAPVRVLELAYGRFDESDIERLEDDYSR